MQFSKIAVAFAFAVGSVAAATNGTVVYTTEILTEYTTVCPAATTLTYNGETITATESQTITLPCPCTVVKPITTSTHVICETCTAVPTSAPVYSNSTTAAVPTTAKATTSVGTTSASTTAATSTFTGAANKYAASGASLAGLLGLAAFVL
ncbi:mmc protein [Phlyctema vagabunda]|uniref:Mmc protein n=1 Tax=Phlyctema vagabunda TaxID=108571 RepID=A0ABR4PMU5_9HELO